MRYTLFTIDQHKANAAVIQLVDALSQELRELLLEHETVQNQLSDADEESNQLQHQLDS